MEMAQSLKKKGVMFTMFKMLGFRCPVCREPLGWLGLVVAKSGQRRSCMSCGVRLEAEDPPWLNMVAMGTLLLMGPLAVSLLIYRHFVVIAVPLGVVFVLALGIVVNWTRRWVICSEQESGYCPNCGVDMRSQQRDSEGVRHCPSCGLAEAP